MVEPPKRDSSDFSANDKGESKKNTNQDRIRKSPKLAGDSPDTTQEERIVHISKIEQQQSPPESLSRKKSVHAENGSSENAFLASKVENAEKVRALLNMPSDKRLKLNMSKLDIGAMLSFGARNQANAVVVLEELAIRHPTLLENIREEGLQAILAAKKNYTLEYNRGCQALFNALKQSNTAFRACLTLEDAMNRPELIAQIESLSINNPDEESRVYRKGCGRPMVLPLDIAKFSSLKHLTIIGCNLTELPSLLGEGCRELEILNVSSNKLTQLPASLGRCKALKELNVNFNDITHLPSELGLCENLTKIFASYNQLEELPSELTKCEKLTDIFLVKNNFTAEYLSSLALLFPGVKIESR